MQFNASTIESWADKADEFVDHLAPLISPLSPAIALAIPVVDGIRALIDAIIGAPQVTPAIAAQMQAAKQQLDTAVNATGAS